MARKAKKIPRNHSEDQEREFWAEADSTDYIDWSEARHLVLPNLKPSLKTISLLPSLFTQPFDFDDACGQSPSSLRIAPIARDCACA